MKLKPYSYLSIQEQWSLTGDQVMEFYDKLVQDNILKDIFYQGPKASREEFLLYLQSPSNLPVFVEIDFELVALGWLNNLNKNYAVGHFCMLKKVWGKHSLDIGKLILTYWFSLSEDKETPIYDVLLGVTPRSNEKALNFITKLGFTLNGSFPHLCKPLGDGIISYMENPLHGRKKHFGRASVQSGSGAVG